MQYTETQLTKLIEDVEKEFTAHLAKAEEEGTPLSAPESDESATLAKAEESEKKPEEEHKPEAEEKKPEAEAKHSDGEPKHEAPAAHEGEEHDYDENDIQHLHQMYGSMSKGELKVHHDACRAALDKCMGMAKSDEDGISASAPGKLPGKEAPASHSHPDVQKAEHSDGLIKPAPPHNAVGPESEASDANGDRLNKMKKGEHTRQSGGKIEASPVKNSPGAKSPASKADGVQMQKSENTEVELLKSELEAVKAEKESLKKNFDGVAAFLTKLVEKKAAPAAKAITSLDTIAKSEGAGEEQPLTKSEIDSKLLQKSQDPSLKKADREAINSYYLSEKDIKGISHLLK